MEMPANLFPPETFANEIEHAVSEAVKASSGVDANAITVKIHDKKWIEEQSMGGVLGVAKGSAQSPYFVEITYVVRCFIFAYICHLH